MRRLMVDSNYLRAPELENYLSTSFGNKVVLMDLQSMEMHKKSAHISAQRSTVITSQFPRQVLLLRPTRAFYTWRINTRAKVSRLISERETRGFAAYGRAHQSKQPTPALSAKTALLEIEHQRHWSKLVRDSAHIPETFKGYAALLTPEERRTIRTHAPYSPMLQRKLLGQARDVAVDLFRVVGNPEKHRPNQKVHLKDTLVFRYALCITLHYTGWLALGQNTSQRATSVANDVVDLHLAALGTFFNGVLTKDRNLESVHRIARHILHAGGAFVG